MRQFEKFTTTSIGALPPLLRMPVTQSNLAIP